MPESKCSAEQCQQCQCQLRSKMPTANGGFCLVCVLVWALLPFYSYSCSPSPSVPTPNTVVDVLLPVIGSVLISEISYQLSAITCRYQLGICRYVYVYTGLAIWRHHRHALSLLRCALRHETDMCLPTAICTGRIEMAAMRHTCLINRHLAPGLWSTTMSHVTCTDRRGQTSNPSYRATRAGALTASRGGVGCG
jgi:hypothetical protein